MEYLSYFVLSTALIMIIFTILRILLRSRNNDKGYHQQQLQNPELVPHPIRDLTIEERFVLRNLLLDLPLTTAVKIDSQIKIVPFYYVIVGVILFIYGVLLIQMILLEIHLLYKILYLMFFTFITFIFINPVLGKGKYYLDLRSPVFELSGKLTLINSSERNNNIFKVGHVFIYDPQQINELKDVLPGSFVKVEYSPYSKHIWNIVSFENAEKIENYS